MSYDDAKLKVKHDSATGRFAILDGAQVLFLSDSLKECEEFTLKPCPFCGGAAWYFDSKWPDGLVLWNVRCKTCYVAFDGHKRLFDAIAAWNRRQP